MTGLSSEASSARSSFVSFIETTPLRIGAFETNAAAEPRHRARAKAVLAMVDDWTEGRLLG